VTSPNRPYPTGLRARDSKEVSTIRTTPVDVFRLSVNGDPSLKITCYAKLKSMPAPSISAALDRGVKLGMRFFRTSRKSAILMALSFEVIHFL